MTTYRLSRSALFFIYGLLGFISVIGVVMFLQGLEHGHGLFSVQPLFILWLGVMAVVWYIYARIPVSISWRDDQVLEFKSIITTTLVPVQDLIAIKSTPLNWGFIKITYNGGSLRLICQITGLYELLYTVKTRNPEVEITGC
jgi:hypothetical protein